jgi:transposase
MLGTDDYFLLKDWFDQGVSICEISRHTGYDGKTIRKYVHSSSPPVYKKRARKASKLEGYRDYITGRSRNILYLPSAFMTRFWKGDSLASIQL